MDISICLATYNGIEFIKEQIDSILPQIGQNDELLISDDGSNDGTLEFLRSLDDSRIRIYENQFKSPIRNFEFLIRKASKMIIFLCDQDDIWKLNKIRTCKNMIESGYDLVLHNCSIIDIKNNIHEKQYLVFKKSIIGNLIKNCFMGSCMVFKKSLLEKILPFPNNIPMHDWWIGLCALKKFKVGYLDSDLTLHRFHDSNASSAKGKSKLNLWSSLVSRFNMATLILFKI